MDLTVPYTAVCSEIAGDDPLLVLGDGAYFLEAIACYAKPLGDLRLVEQTTRGLMKLELDAALDE
jgi:hypothetical protein